MALLSLTPEEDAVSGDLWAFGLRELLRGRSAVRRMLAEALATIEGEAGLVRQ
jgi:hypothetical protein